MTRRYGSMSVKDHIDPLNCAKSLLMFEKLIFPTPDGEEEYQRWTEQDWEPELLHKRLEQMGEFAEQVPWNDARRAQWSDFMKEGELIDGFCATRSVLAKSDAHVVAAYQSVSELRKKYALTPSHDKTAALCVVLRVPFMDPVNNLCPEAALDKALILAKDWQYIKKRQALYDWQDHITSKKEFSTSQALEHIQDLISEVDAAAKIEKSNKAKIYGYTLLGPLLGTAGMLAGDFNATQAAFSALGIGLAFAQLYTIKSDPTPVNYQQTTSPIAMIQDIEAHYG